MIGIQSLALVCFISINLKLANYSGKTVNARILSGNIGRIF